MKITLFTSVIIFYLFYKFYILLKCCFYKDILTIQPSKSITESVHHLHPLTTPPFKAEEHPNKVLHHWHHHLFLFLLSFNFCDSMYCTDIEINSDKPMFLNCQLLVIFLFMILSLTPYFTSLCFHLDKRLHFYQKG